MIDTLLASVTSLVCGAATSWHCEPDAGTSRIYFANHSSHLDFLIIWSSLPAGVRRRTRPVAGSDYWQRGAVRRYLAGEVFRAILIERAQAERGSHGPRAATERMAAALDAGASLIVFPEGTRSSDGQVAPFKSGLFHLSQSRPDTELIPVHLENLNRILPKGEILPVPMLCRVVFGSPLPGIPGEEKPVFLARARESLLHLRGQP